MLGIVYTFSASPVPPDLALKAQGRFINRPTTTGGKQYDKFFLYVPTELANDSQFPFKAGDIVQITVDPKKKTISLSKN